MAAFALAARLNEEIRRKRRGCSKVSLSSPSTSVTTRKVILEGEDKTCALFKALGILANQRLHRIEYRADEQLSKGLIGKREKRIEEGVILKVECFGLFWSVDVANGRRAITGGDMNPLLELEKEQMGPQLTVEDELPGHDVLQALPKQA
jgi:hypothetical protein